MNFGPNMSESNQDQIRDQSMKDTMNAAVKGGSGDSNGSLTRGF